MYYAHTEIFKDNYKKRILFYTRYKVTHQGDKWGRGIFCGIGPSNDLHKVKFHPWKRPQ